MGRRVETVKQRIYFFFYIHLMILIFDIGFLWLLDWKFGKYSFTEIFWYTTLYLLTISQKTNSIRHVPWPMIQLWKFSNTQVLPFCISKQETQQGSKFFFCSHTGCSKHSDNYLHLLRVQVPHCNIIIGGRWYFLLNLTTSCNVGGF